MKVRYDFRGTKRRISPGDEDKEGDCTWRCGQGGGGEEQEEVGGHWQEMPGRRHNFHYLDPYRPMLAVVILSEI